jgi:hypothetical protein
MYKTIMNRIIFLLASVIAAVTFASEASALPLFARQTGMECAACHFQHFPMLTAFGRAFKAGAYTLMGTQGKVEGDNLSIPNTLNMAILTTAGYSKNNSDTAATIDPVANAAGARSTGDGTFYMPGTNGEFSLFVGGRTSENSGALAELGMVQDAGTGAGLSSAKIPMLWEVASGTRAGVVPYTTDGQGASYGFEELNTGANAVHTMLFIGGDFNGSVAPVLSAQQYIGTAAPATGFAFVVNNPGYFVNLTKFNQVGPADLGGAGAALTSTYLRAAAIFDLAGWDTGVGVQSWSGTSANVTFSDTVVATDPLASPPGTVCTVDGNCTASLSPSFVQMETKAWAIDGQMQNTLANNMPLGIYVTYASAAASDAVIVNAYNGGSDTRSSFNIAAELGVIPEKVTVGFGIRRGKSGDTTITGSNASDNAYLLEASYKLAQNMLLNLVYTSQSGDYWNATNTSAIGSKQTYINLATIF